MSTTEIRIWAILLIGMIVVTYFMYQKVRNTRLAKNNILAAIRNRAGRWRFEVMPIKGGLVRLPPKVAGEAGKLFVVDSESAPDVDFPINKWPFIQTTIPMAVFDEETWEPLSNVAGRPVLPTGLLDVIRYEGWSAHGIRLAHVVEEKEHAKEAVPSRKKISIWNIVMVIAIIGLIALCYWGYTEMQGLRAAAGV